MQIKSTPSIDTFLAPRIASQATRGNGDNESFSRLMQQRRDQAATSTESSFRRTTDLPPKESTYDMSAKPSMTSDASVSAKANANEQASTTTRDTTDADSAATRSRDGNTTRDASESKALAARKAESARLGKHQGSGKDDDAVASADSGSTTEPVSPTDEAAGSSGMSTADWIAMMSDGRPPKQAPIVDPADADATGATSADPASITDRTSRAPIGAVADAPVMVIGGKLPTIGIVPEPQPDSTVETPVSASDNPISLTPTTSDFAQRLDKQDKGATAVQSGDPTTLAMLQSAAGANDEIRKNEKASSSEPVGNLDGNVSAAAAVVGTTAQSTSRSAEVPTVQIATPVNAPEFKEVLGVQISMMAKDGVQHAQLHLNPADMGPISVQIATEGTHARVDFGADSAATRQILEAGLPELASALRDAGMTLTGGSVSQDSQSNSQSGSGSRDESRGSRRMVVGVEGSSTLGAPTVARTQRGNLDLYA